jgi:transcriptional/translational regulatory protein YebC/TACO1
VFTKFGGYLGAPGSVAYLFKPVGRMIYARGTDMVRLTRLGFGAGAEDIFLNSAGAIEVLTDPVELEAVRAQLWSVGLKPARADFTQHASVSVPLAGVAAATMLGLIEALRALDDVQDVYSNAEISDALVAQL